MAELQGQEATNTQRQQPANCDLVFAALYTVYFFKASARLWPQSELQIEMARPAPAATQA